MTNPTKRVDAALGKGLVNVADAVRADDEHGDLRDGDRWGPWVWNADAMTLEYTRGGYANYPYGVDVERIIEADHPDAEAWEWVQHVAGKRWPPPAIRCFVLGLRAVLRQRGGASPDPRLSDVW